MPDMSTLFVRLFSTKIDFKIFYYFLNIFFKFAHNNIIKVILIKSFITTVTCVSAFITILIKYDLIF